MSSFLNVHAARHISSRGVRTVRGAAPRQGAVRQDGRHYGSGSVSLARCDYLLLRAYHWTTSKV